MRSLWHLSRHLTARADDNHAAPPQRPRRASTSLYPSAAVQARVRFLAYHRIKPHVPPYVCPFTVRVPPGLSLAVFLGSLITCTVARPRGDTHTFGFQLGSWICLRSSTPTPFNAHIRQRAAVSLLRHHIAPYGSHGILTVSAIGLAVRLILRTRLTPG